MESKKKSKLINKLKVTDVVGKYKEVPEDPTYYVRWF